MLVLSRKKNETIRIGEDVTIVVVDIRGDKVRLGVRAPDSVAVHRAEVFDAIKREVRGGVVPSHAQQVAATPSVEQRLDNRVPETKG